MSEYENILYELEIIKNYTILSSKEVLTFDDAVLLTGLSKSHLYKLTSERIIPFYKPNGKQIYFDRLELVSWLKRNRFNSMEEAEQKALAYCLTQKDERPEAKTYIVMDINTGLYKIGKAVDIGKRMSGLMCANPGLELIAYHEENKENKIHQECKDCHVFREWYNLDNKRLNQVINKHGFKIIDNNGKDKDSTRL